MDGLSMQLQQIFREVFDEPELILRNDMTASDVAGWDSLTHVNLVIAIERELGIRFATAEMSKIKEAGQNVGSLIHLIESKVKGNGA